MKATTYDIIREEFIKTTMRRDANFFILIAL